MWGAQVKSGGTSKNFGRRFAPALCPHLQIASDATDAVLSIISTAYHLLPGSMGRKAAIKLID